MPVEGPQYPVLLDLAGRSCLVVGGGPVALGKVRGLLAVDARVTVVAPDVLDELAALEGVTVVARAYESGDLAGHRLAITATGDPAVDHQVFLDGEAAGVWVNSADDPANCAFTLPAVVRQGPITLAVSTGGHSPALAKWLRDRLADELGPEHEVLLQLLAERREALRSAGIPTEGLSWQVALDSGMLDLVREGRVAEARELLQACL
ncbi:MAG: uroporphyrin-III C-methyltransferase [Actinomycetia bacterium]|nr:uroporphyrin-III C-methyltransferase [Actinomycetes bacterium]